MNRQRHIGIVVATVALAAGVSSAAVIEPGLYQLGNHPDGNQDPPAYGLRLDELQDVSPNADVFTFDFEAPGSDVRLEYDGSSIHIYGTAFGGLDTGNGYDPDRSGFVEIDFTYVMTGLAVGDDDLVVSTPDGTNSGSITYGWDGQSVNVPLFDYSGQHDYTFRLGNEDDDNGHRGFDGVSGWGWLSYADGHISASDWLFTIVAPVPAPGALAVLGLGLIAPRRRRDH